MSLLGGGEGIHCYHILWNTFSEHCKKIKPTYVVLWPGGREGREQEEKPLCSSSKCLKAKTKERRKNKEKLNKTRPK